MAIPITVPRQGWSMEEGTFIEWLKRDGEVVKPGDALYVLESEKSTEQIEAIDAGILRITRQSPAPGAVVKVGQVLGYLAAVDEAIGEQPSQESRVRNQESGVRGQESAVAQSSPKASLRALGIEGRKHIATPRARRATRGQHVDLAAIVGSGRGGRIRERDVLAAAAGQSKGKLIPHTPLRRTIAARMVAGVTQAAPVTLTTKVDATRLVARRNAFKTKSEVPPSYTDLLIVHCAAALKEHPLLQAQWRDDGLFVPDVIDIAFAVDTEAGLLAPVVRGVDRLSVSEVAEQTRELIAQAREGRLTAEQMRGATFTISNLGMYGIDAFTPIIHLPQCAVLGVGRIVNEPAVVDHQIVPRPMLTLSLTFDHRVIDGAPAARFLDALRRQIEEAR